MNLYLIAMFQVKGAEQVHLMTQGPRREQWGLHLNWNVSKYFEFVAYHLKLHFEFNLKSMELTIPF